MNRSCYKGLFFVLCCLTLLLVNQSSCSKERYQRKRISLAEFLYQRLHKFGIKGKRNQVLAAKQPKTGIKSGRTPGGDKINYLLQNSDKDPNLAVLRNYFHKIKSVSQAVDHHNTSSSSYDANAGFGPLVSQTSHKKRRIRRKRPRSRRKIFLTVNEAFSRSEFNGREMGELNKNYLMYVPIKASNKYETLDNKQYQEEDEAYQNRRIDIATNQDNDQEAIDEYMTIIDDYDDEEEDQDGKDVEYEFYSSFETKFNSSINISDPWRYQTDFDQDYTYKYSNPDEEESKKGVLPATVDDVVEDINIASDITLLGSRYETNFEANDQNITHYQYEVKPLDKMSLLADESLYMTKFEDENNMSMLSIEDLQQTTTIQGSEIETTTFVTLIDFNDEDEMYSTSIPETSIKYNPDLDKITFNTITSIKILDTEEELSTIEVDTNDQMTTMASTFSDIGKVFEGHDVSDPLTTMTSTIGEKELTTEEEKFNELVTTVSTGQDTSENKFYDMKIEDTDSFVETSTSMSSAVTVSESITEPSTASPTSTVSLISSSDQPATSVASVTPGQSLTSTQATSTTSIASVTPSTSTSSLLSSSLTSIPSFTFPNSKDKPVKLPLTSNENKDENKADDIIVKDDSSFSNNEVFIPIGHGFYYKFLLNHQNKLEISEI